MSLRNKVIVHKSQSVKELNVFPPLVMLNLETMRYASPMRKVFMFKVIMIFILFSVCSGFQAGYASAEKCKNCHEKEYASWRHSQHALAMQVASGGSVLGNFDNASFSYNGITSTFFMRDGRYMVRTDGEDGRLQDFEISHTFGIHPLQQYLVPFPDGRFQVLDIAWDSRKKEQGGQRWMHLHPHENVTANDELHWTGINLNWNAMCADCHSTRVRKNYNPENKTYQTRYAVINVSCEACHGEGKQHIAWAADPRANAGMENKGLSIDLSAFGQPRWSFHKQTGKPELKVPVNRAESRLCARCHARRAQLAEGFQAGDDYEDYYLDAVLDDHLYFNDGKIKDEVFVYGSFRQSKMFQAGVTCSDCHDAHSISREEMNPSVCYRCHAAAAYEHTSHHRHKQGSATCIDCHMPARTYMVVDVRNDHSFRVPRPDLSDKLKAPNACNLCHQDKSNAWSVNALKQWYGDIPVGYQQFSAALLALNRQDKTALDELYRVLLSDAPDIAKASVTGFLGSYPSRQTYMTTLQMLKHPSMAIRLQAIQALDGFPLEMRVRPLFEVLEDARKPVRIEAARGLSTVAQGKLPEEKKKVLERELSEYKTSLLLNADRPESQLSLARLHQGRGEHEFAKVAFEEAIRLHRWHVPAYVNYADYLRRNGDEKAAREMLDSGLAVNPEHPALHQALGLWQVRNKQPAKALASLEKAAKLAPDEAQYQYVYAVALSGQDVDAAIRVLEANIEKHSGHLDSIAALGHYYRLAGDTTEAEKFTREAQQMSQFIPHIDGSTTQPPRQ